VQSKNFREVSIFICRSDFLSFTGPFLLASTVIVQVCKGMAAGFGKKSSLRFSKKSPHRWVVFFRKTLYFQPCRP
jgi:hypothetical protein